MYSKMTEQGIPPEDIELDRQLIFYNELFGWARVAFQALADRALPDRLFGPSQEGKLVQAPAVISFVCCVRLHRCAAFDAQTFPTKQKKTGFCVD